MKRQRGRNRNNNRNNNNNPNRSMDSNGPDVKVRGNASTIYEKYTSLARDAQSSGNRVKAENLRQHGEHYLRLMNAQEAAKQAAQEEREAAKQAAREANGESGDKDQSDTDTDSRKGRRYPPRVKSSQKSNERPRAKETKTDDGLEVVTPKSETQKADNDDLTDVAEKPKGRRKAPARKDDVAIDAAE